MREMFITAGALISPVAAVLAALVAYGTLKMRKNAPGEEREKDYDQWRDSVDKRLLNDHDRLKKLESSKVESDEFQKLVLRCLQGMLELFRDGEHGEGMADLNKEINEFLVER